MLSGLFVTCFCVAGLGQKVTLSGRITDEKTGEKLSEASLFVKTTNSVVKTNKYGYYSITVQKGTHQLLVSQIGYRTQEYSINIGRDTSVSFGLKTLEYDLEEVRISAGDDSFSDKDGNSRIPIAQIKKTPALLSEPDVLKSLQLLPGVQQGTEGTAGLHIRGGSPDQTLILIDGVPVYNAFHLFGFFSVFNPDAVSDVKLYKNNLPAKYGGRLSAVVDIETREGNRKESRKRFSISPISGKLTIEGPIKKDKSSFIIAARQTWVNALLALVQANSSNRQSYGFYDINAKVNHTFNANNQLYLSFYRGRDALINKNGGNENSTFQYNWGNYTAILRWNQIVNQKLFQNTTFSFSNYKYQLQNSYQSAEKTFDSKFSSAINDWQARTDWDYFASPKNLLNAGVSYTLHRFSPEINQVSGTLIQNNSEQPQQHTFVGDFQAYVQTVSNLSKNVTLNSGLHYNWLTVNAKNYANLQPRISLNWDATPSLTLRGAFFKTYQYLHLLTNSSLGLPTDLWVPITEKVPPQQSNQWNIGASKKYKGFTLSLDAYFKKMEGLIEYQEGSSFLNDFSSKWYDKVVIGKGSSKGIEFFAQKTTGKTKGFVSYTLSKTDRVFEDINLGEPFPYKYDRRHSLSVNVNHSFRSNKELSVTFSLQSGSMVSLPAARFSSVVPPAGDLFSLSTFSTNYPEFYANLGHLPYRNNFRLPLFHRLDVNYQTSKKLKKGKRKWIFSVYNLYNRANPFFIFYQKNQLKQFSLLPILPSLSYEYEF